MHLPCQAGLFHHSPQLIHIPFFFLKKKRWSALFPLSVFHSSAAPTSFKAVIFREGLFLTIGQQGLVPLPHTHLGPDSTSGWGEQRGEGWTLCLHHRRSGALCTLILDY